MSNNNQIKFKCSTCDGAKGLHGLSLADIMLGDMPDIKDWPEAEREKMRGYLDGTYNPPLYPDI